MEAKAHLKYLRMSPRKVKIVCDMIRGKDVATATAYMMQTPKAACEPVLKLLKSAVAEGHFAPGSMLPKVQAAVRFAKSAPGRTALITLLDKARDGIAGKTGTAIHQ